MATLLSSKTLKTQLYQTDQQVKYLHLEAEIDILLQKITTIKQQKDDLQEISTASSKSLSVGAE